MTTQMILWLDKPMAVNGGIPVQVIAADVIDTEGNVATLQLAYGTMKVVFAHSYVDNSGDVTTGTGWVNEAGFIDFRQGL